MRIAACRDLLAASEEPKRRWRAAALLAPLVPEPGDRLGEVLGEAATNWWMGMRDALEAIGDLGPAGTPPRPLA